MESSFLVQACVYLGAAVVAVPLASRAGLGSVLGYLVAGAAIGPHVLGWVGSEGTEVRDFAEFGVVMMLFLIGLELEPARLWKLRRPILGMGGLQLAGTAGLVASCGMVLGTPLRTGLALGLVVAMSSTAIAMQTLREKGLDRSAAGQASFAVLLFQDLAVIPVLAVLPLLALHPVVPTEAPRGIATLPGWLQGLAVLAAVAVVVVAGRWLSRPVFRFIARAGLHEAFIALSLLLLAGITLLMNAVGLSPALGAFVGGVVLANSEYRHELVSDIEPFKGLLLALFFLTVGAGIDFPVIGAQWGTVAALVLGVVVLKFASLVALGLAFRMSLSESILVGTALCQIGEFSFVLLGVCGALGVLDPTTAAVWTGVVALSMALSPILFAVTERVVLPQLDRPATGRAMDVPSGHAPVLIAGFGRMGNMIGRILRAQGIATTVLERDPTVVDLVRRVGLHAFYGDASRTDLLQAAGAEHARLLILAMDDGEKALEIAREARRRYPNLEVLARVSGHPQAYAFVREGFTHVYRETYGTAMEMGNDALRLLGVRGHQAHRAVQAFRLHNQRAVRDLAHHWGDEKRYFARLREKIEEAEDALRRSGLGQENVDHAWDNTSLAEEMLADDVPPARRTADDVL